MLLFPSLREVFFLVYFVSSVCASCVDICSAHGYSVGEGACCNCRVLNLVSTCFVFSSVPCPIAVAMMFHVETIGHTVFLLRKLECFKHVLWRNQVSRWYVLRTTQNGDFVLLPLCVAPCWRTGARLAQWRPSVLSLPLVFSLCTCALLLNIHLDSCDRTQAISSNKSYPLHHLQHKKNTKRFR